MKNFIKLSVLFLGITCFSGISIGQNIETSIWKNCKSDIDKTKEYGNQSYDGSYDGDKYKGQQSNGTREGLGAYYWSEGSCYFGNWSNGQRTGFGMLLVREGYFISGCDNCAVYVGNWNNSKQSGNGVCYDKLGNLIYAGKFSNGKPTETYPMTVSLPAYKFQTIEYDSGDKYIGETQSGKRNGYGIYVWSSGDAWFGDWENGERSGKGISLLYNSSWQIWDCKGNDCKILDSYNSSNSSQSEEQRQAAEREHQQDEHNRQQAEKQAEINRQEAARQAEAERQAAARRQDDSSLGVLLDKPASQGTGREVNANNASRQILTLNSNTTFLSPEGDDIIFLIKYVPTEGYCLSYINSSGQQRRFTSNNVKIKVKYKYDDNEYSYTDACFIKMDIGRQNLKLSDVFFDISSRKEIEDIRISFEQSKIE